MGMGITQLKPGIEQKVNGYHSTGTWYHEIEMDIKITGIWYLRIGMCITQLELGIT